MTTTDEFHNFSIAKFKIPRDDVDLFGLLFREPWLCVVSYADVINDTEIVVAARNAGNYHSKKALPFACHLSLSSHCALLCRFWTSSCVMEYSLSWASGWNWCCWTLTNDQLLFRCASMLSNGWKQGSCDQLSKFIEGFNYYEHKHSIGTTEITTVAGQIHNRAKTDQYIYVHRTFRPVKSCCTPQTT